jgi:hypothetical protein
VLVQQLSGYLDVAVSMRRWLKNRCGLSSLEATRGLCRIGPGSLASLAPSGNLRAEGPVHCITGSPRSTRSALANSGRAPRPSPLGIRASRVRWTRGLGSGVLVEVGAQARHGVGESADVDADEGAVFCPGQLFLTALHAVGGQARPAVGSCAMRANQGSMASELEWRRDQSRRSRSRLLRNRRSSGLLQRRRRFATPTAGQATRTRLSKANWPHAQLSDLSTSSSATTQKRRRRQRRSRSEQIP